VCAAFCVAEGLPLPIGLVVRQRGLACGWAPCTPRPDGNGSVAATLKPADFCVAATLKPADFCVAATLKPADGTF